ncbi:MAG: hypothetical protein EA376_07735 [Phycisphaeraceae bacterium]|nr:MAG: hypothetical protein EA376_07735 [Phycisphaeraceae bacterium]
MHRILSVLMIVAASFAAHAADPQEVSSALSREASAAQHVETIEIRAVVLDAGGAPVEDAVVVTSAGGQGVTGNTGAALFNVAIDPSAESLHITAAAVIGGANHVGNVRLDTLNSSTSIDAGAITLAAATDCEPAWIPTFGGKAGVNDRVYALTVFDDGSGGGPALYAGGLFSTAGGEIVNRIAKWDGAAWSPLGSGMNNWVNALTVFDDGSGPALYAGGGFTTAGDVTVFGIAKWDGASWSPLGSGMNNPVDALTVFDDGTGPALYAGGLFTAAGGQTVNRIAKWDGASWSPLGSGMDASVNALKVFDDGSGTALYAGGTFSTAGGMSANRIAKWDGATWSPLGSGVSGGDFPFVTALTVFDDGSGGGPALYAGGDFTTASGVSTDNIAKWDGASWSPLGSGMNDNIRALTVFDDGSGGGLALYAGGFFTSAGGVTATSHIAKWDGAAWSPLGSGMNGNVRALTVFDDGSGGGPALYAGGFFTTAGDESADRIAKWQGCPVQSIPGDLNGDGAVGSADLAILLGNWGMCPPEPDPCPADLNGDGSVGSADLAILLGNWGATAPE